MLGFKAEMAGKLSHWASGLSLKMKTPFSQNYTNFLVSKTKDIWLSNAMPCETENRHLTKRLGAFLEKSWNFGVDSFITLWYSMFAFLEGHQTDNTACVLWHWGRFKAHTTWAWVFLYVLKVFCSVFHWIPIKNMKIFVIYFVKPHVYFKKRKIGSL